MYVNEMVEMVNPSKILKVELSDYGSYLGRAEGCFEVRNKNGKIDRYPHFENEIGEAVLKSGSYVSVDALIDLALWNIDTYIVTRNNRVVAFLRNLEDDNHVEVRIAQYQALTNGKGLEIAKQLVLSKLEGSQRVLCKYGLEPLELDIVQRQVSAIPSNDFVTFRRKLIGIEARCARLYFDRIFSLFPEGIRPENRRSRKAYDGINNVFNFGYYVLKCRVHKAIVKAKLEPFLGFLHALKDSTPSLVCDFMEPYRYLIDDLLIERCQKYRKKDFVAVTDFMMNLRMGKKIHLCEYETDDLAEALNELFDRKVNIPRIRHGFRQTLDTLVSEETKLLSKYIESEKNEWIPRLVDF
jgi:CRISP-associated protein Cas1